MAISYLDYSCKRQTSLLNVVLVTNQTEVSSMLVWSAARGPQPDKLILSIWKVVKPLLSQMICPCPDVINRVDVSCCVPSHVAIRVVPDLPENIRSPAKEMLCRWRRVYDVKS